MSERDERAEIVRKDKAHVWHPYTAMDAYIESTDPFVITRALGAWLEDVDGRRYLDGNSSWYVASLGHGHPRLLDVLHEQSSRLVHCSLAGTTHAPAALLAEELLAIAPPGFERVFYTDNGSSSVEVAVKMALQMWQNLGQSKKTRFIALDGAFHGDTLGAAALGGVEIFRRPFAGVLFDCVHAPFPERDAYARAFDTMKDLLRSQRDSLAAVVVEPIVQGAAGMRIYDPQYLRELRALCDECDVLLIFDEVFSGYGRTGPMWASSHAGVSPDLMCLGKTFATLLPMGATLATGRIFDAFRGDKTRALYYGHTFCGHPLGAALAREVLAIFREEKILDRAKDHAVKIEAAFRSIGNLAGVERVRNVGMIGAADLSPGKEVGNGASSGGGYLGSRGWQVYEEARRRGAYLRPLGDTVYVTPPLTMTPSELDALLGIVEESIRAVG